MTTTTTTILIKRDSDKNYDKLFAKVDRFSSYWGKSASEQEYETPEGYVVILKSAAPEVIEFVQSKPKDYAIL